MNEMRWIVCEFTLYLPQNEKKSNIKYLPQYAIYALAVFNIKCVFFSCMSRIPNKLHKINNNKIKQKSGLKLDILCVGI